MAPVFQVLRFQDSALLPRVAHESIWLLRPLLGPGGHALTPKARPRTATLLAFLLVAGVTVVAPAADSAPPPPTLGKALHRGAGWVAATFTIAPGGFAALELLGTAGTPPWGAGFWLLDADGTVLAGFLTFADPWDRTTPAIDLASAPVGVDVHYGPRQDTPSSPGGSISVGGSPSGPRRYSLLAAGASSDASSLLDFTLRGHGVTGLGMDSAGSAVFKNLQDLAAASSHVDFTPTSGFDVGAVGEHRTTIANSLYGYFGPLDEPQGVCRGSCTSPKIPGVLEVHSPDARLTGSRFKFEDWSPGDYLFRVALYAGGGIPFDTAQCPIPTCITMNTHARARLVLFVADFHVPR